MSRRNIPILMFCLVFLPKYYEKKIRKIICQRGKLPGTLYIWGFMYILMVLLIKQIEQIPQETVEDETNPIEPDHLTF